MQFRLDRSIPIPLAEQIKGQIAYAISYGYLRPGESLPSVRELSATLHVAPMTISQVYRDLSQQGLVVSRAGVGTFVADIALAGDERPEGPAQGGLRQLVETCVQEAQAQGFGLEEIRAAFLTCIASQAVTGSAAKVLVAGNFQLATESYAREIEGIWRDLNVEVVPVLLRDLQASSQACLQELLRGVKFAITVPTRLYEVRQVLEPFHCRVVAAAFTISPETRRCLAGIDPTQRVGIVSTYPEFLQTIIDNVAAYALLKTPPVCLIRNQEERIREMLKVIDVLVYASGSESVCEILPPGVQAFEYRHSPEPDSVNRLRPLLGNEDVLLSVDEQRMAPIGTR